MIAREDTIVAGALSDAGHRTSGYGLGETVPVLLISSWRPEHNHLCTWLLSQSVFFVIGLHKSRDLDTDDLQFH